MQKKIDEERQIERDLEDGESSLSKRVWEEEGEVEISEMEVESTDGKNVQKGDGELELESGLISEESKERVVKVFGS